MNSKNNQQIPKIGAYILETLTVGMYKNPLDSLREYVQNSFDSINDAQKDALLKNGEGRVEIYIDKDNHRLRIRDNGIGISSTNVSKYLLNIGMSSKSIHSSAGFRGIGRLAGIAYCKNLIFRTQAPNEKTISSVIFNCVEIRKAISASMKQVKELTDVISQYSRLETESTKKENHFFEVVMEEIDVGRDIFLEWVKLKSYLSQVAPLGFDFQSFPLSKKILNWTNERKIKIPTVRLTIKSGTLNVEVFKPYQKLTYTTKKDNHKIDIKDIIFYPDNAGPNSPYWLWYADTNLPGMFGDEEVSELRLRKQNISIGGGDRVSEMFVEIAKSQGRFNAYFMGEIYIQDLNVVPNGQRDGFEDNQSWRDIRESLIEFFFKLGKDVRNASDARNTDTQKLIRRAEKEISKIEKVERIGLVNKREQDALLVSLDKQIEKFSDAITGDRKPEEIELLNTKKEQLITAKLLVQDNVKFVTQNLDSSLQKKQLKIIRKIIDRLYDDLDKNCFDKVLESIYDEFGIQRGELD